MYGFLFEWKLCLVPRGLFFFCKSTTACKCSQSPGQIIPQHANLILNVFIMDIFSSILSDLIYAFSIKTPGYYFN